MTDVDEKGILDITEVFIAEHGGDDEAVRLGAQFDAGLAWVHFAPGEGGLGLSVKLQRTIDERLRDAHILRSWLRNPMGIGMVAPTIAVHGTPGQKAHLRPIFTGEEIWCQLFSEPGAGSDVASLATRAVRDGEQWILNGQKIWTTHARTSSYGLLLARSDPHVPKHNGLTCFLLDMQAAGVEVRPIRQINGAAQFNEVYMTDVRVDDSRRLGPEGDGWRVAVTTLMNERVSIGADSQPSGAGPISRAVDAYRAAGSPGGVYRDRLMRTWIEAEVIRMAGIRAQQMRAKGMAGPEGSVLKLAKSSLGQLIADLIVDMNGPASLLSAGWPPADRDDPVYRLLQAQSDTIAGGTTEVMRNILGERVLGLPGEPRVDLVPWDELPKSSRPS